jgi:hypothetical protein
MATSTSRNKQVNPQVKGGTITPEFKPKIKLHWRLYNWFQRKLNGK